ncbi:hypothetical protein [Jongsikchunia kroppenstedtii]|uniref:hypothetical protein n=1 Tax=Jongsikchunia kroppenstedtii TaxID=1121721 RepID=UPI0003A9FAE5|nr:hypothetical protein [Jongsikchunia kroppenstedtii]
MRNMARSLVTASIGAAAVMSVVAGCSSSSSSSSADSSSSAAVVTPSSNSNAPVVGGPNLPAATSVPSDKAEPTISGKKCGQTRGPDGALQVVIFPGSHVGCSDAMAVAGAFGPLMSQGTDQKVKGWDCGPSQIAGVLAKCTKGSDTFGFLTQ